MRPITEFLRSLRRAPRTLARTPAISIASIATLAIALGATTTIFSVFYSVVMRPLPFRDPDGLVQLNARAEDGRLLGVSQVELADWATQVPSFESVALYGFSQFTLTDAGDPELLRGAVVSSEFFALLSAPMQLGRGLAADDGVLSRTASERFFPDGDAVGRRLRVFASGGQPDATVVGVVGDVKFAGMDAPPDGAIYVPHTQRTFRTQYLVVRTGGATGPAIQLIRKAVRGVDASLAMSDIRTVADLVTAATAGPRFQSTLLALFAFLALSLAGIGLYGVITHIVGHRAREFAVRLALGATPTDLLRLVLGKALVLSAIGAVIGTGVSLALARGMSSLFFGMEPIDTPSFLAAVLLTLTIGIAAAVGPAIHAARLQPSATLRST